MKLFPYQEEGVEWMLRRRRSYLADGMGLGKTPQAIVAAIRYVAKRTLVVAPASALDNWRREWGIWGAPWATMAAVSYDRLVRNPHLYQGGDWDLVILDEAHYVKGRGSKRTLAALTVARDAKRAILLSASPMPNHAGELWAPFRALWPGVPRELEIDDYDGWLNKFCSWTHTIYGPKIWGTKNGHLLRPYLARLMLRRQLADVGIELPPLRVDVHLLPRDAAFAEALERAGVDADALGEAMDRESDDEDGSVSRLRRYVGEYKAARIGDLIADELKHRAYRKIVVLAYHTSVLSHLEAKLEPFGVVGFTGQTRVKDRQPAIDEFNTGTARVFLAQQSAAGVAINLQAASEIVLVEPPWSPDDMLQMIKRIHRIGQKSPCRARLFGVAGTLDESMTEVRARKARMQISLGL